MSQASVPLAPSACRQRELLADKNHLRQVGPYDTMLAVVLADAS
jgi:hypothetical protein